MAEKEKKSVVKAEKTVVDSKEDVIIKDNEINDRINRLYGLISDEPSEVHHEYSPEELTLVRKKLVFLLGGVIVAGIIIIVLLLEPFSFKKDNKNNKPNIDGEEINNNINKEDESYTGELDLSDQLVQKLVGTIDFTNQDFKTIDLFPLYEKDAVEIKDISNDIKLHLLTRSQDFYDMLRDNGIDKYIETCDSNGLVIDKSKIESVVTSLFGPNAVLEYKNINYLYSIGYEINKKITLTYANNQYLVKCNEFTENNTVTKFVQQQTNKAIGLDNSIEVYQYVVFINETGVYKEPNFKTLITNNKNDKIPDYISKGNTYKYTFSKNGNSYYLSKIELVK